MQKPVIIGVGKYLPGEPVSTEQLLKSLDVPKKLTPEFVNEKIGVKFRHICRHMPTVEELAQPDFNAAEYDWENKNGVKKGCNCSDLAAESVKEAVKMAGIQLKQIEFLIVSTATPDYPIPPTSAFTMDKLGINNIGTMDIRSACCGSSQALFTAVQTIRSGEHKYVAVVGSEVGSAFGKMSPKEPGFDKGDYINNVLMGDGAACFIIKGFGPNEKIEKGIEILDVKLGGIGQGQTPGMWLQGGGCVYPMSTQFINEGRNHFVHDAPGVLKHGPLLYMTGLNQILERNKLTLADIDLFLPHQANGQVANIGKGLGVNPEKIYMNIERVGNTGNASLGLQLEEIVFDNKLKKGSYLVMVGAESTKWLYGGTLLKWHGNLVGKQNNDVKQEAGYISKQIARIRMWGLNKFVQNQSGAKL